MNPLLIAGLVLLVLLVAVVGAWSARRRKPAGEARYVARGELLTPAERAFFAAVDAAIGSEYRIFPMVRVADVINVEADRKAHLPAFNRISAKHFDFVVCTLDTLLPLAAIELNDVSHQRPDRRHRDEFLRGVCAEAGLPLIEFAPRRAYKLDSLRQQLLTAMGIDDKAGRREPHLAMPRVAFVREEDSVDASVAAAPVAAPLAIALPSLTARPPASSARREPQIEPAAAVEHAGRRCPKCGGEAQRRRIATGQLAGREFWLCRTFPKCSGLLPVATL